MIFLATVGISKLELETVVDESLKNPLDVTIPVNGIQSVTIIYIQ